MNYQMRETANGTDIKGVQIMVDIKKKWEFHTQAFKWLKISQSLNLLCTFNFQLKVLTT